MGCDLPHMGGIAHEVADGVLAKLRHTMESEVVHHVRQMLHHSLVTGIPSVKDIMAFTG